MKKPIITLDNTEILNDKRFLRFYDINYAEGRHYFEVSRRSKENLVAMKTDDEFKKILPDAVTLAVVLHLPNEEPNLLLSYEYRYPTGQFQLSPVAGLIDEEDLANENPLFSSAIRELKEESGITFGPNDNIRVLNPCAFSSPGMTDESNAFLCVDAYLDNLDCVNQNGAVGGELFDGFVILNKAEAKRIYENGRDDHGIYYSLATWAVLGYFLMQY